MQLYDTLENYLADAVEQGVTPAGVAGTILAIAAATTRIETLIGRGPLGGKLDESLGANADGDTQKALDVLANDCIIAAMADAPIAYLVSEELPQPLLIDATGTLIVAVDPLDGSSNIETNLSVGSIFSIFPAAENDAATVNEQVLQPGNRQLAAGYCIYGPQTSLVLTLGAGTAIFTLDAATHQYKLTTGNIRMPETRREFAINVSNFRHWDAPIRDYINDCLDGEDGLQKSNYNMRWVASLVAECHRILARGGVFLYPRDARKGYTNGRLRLLYEANPIAFLVEQAGGGATTGQQRILDIPPDSIHQRVPLIFGAIRETRRVERFYAEPDASGERSPLFNKRGLFRV